MATRVVEFDRTAECCVFMTCPHCGVRQSVIIDALVSSGSVPSRVQQCDDRDCAKHFTVEATLSVDVQPT